MSFFLVTWHNFFFIWKYGGTYTSREKKKLHFACHFGHACRRLYISELPFGVIVRLHNPKNSWPKCGNMRLYSQMDWPETRYMGWVVIRPTHCTAQQLRNIYLHRGSFSYTHFMCVCVKYVKIAMQRWYLAGRIILRITG